MKQAKPDEILGWMCGLHQDLMSTFRSQYASGDPLQGEKDGEHLIVFARHACLGKKGRLTKCQMTTQGQ